MSNNSISSSKKALLVTGLLAIAGSANAGYTLKLSDDDSLTFGGYIKADVRYVDGNIAATDYWYGGGTVLSEDQSNFGIAVNETRFNAKYVHGDVTGFIEMDFYGDAVSGGGNEVISNSSQPRLRHAFIKYKDVLIGQTWTTFQNTSSLAEAADFGGPLVASGFIRQSMVRYSNGGLQLSIENPETYGGYRGDKTTRDDSVPDFIAKYTFKGDWGNVSVSGLARQLKSLTNESESAFGYGIAGRIKTFGKDDFRFQLHGGEVGRYVGVTASTDMVGEEVEDTTSIMVAYRHFWTEDMRSSVFYGNTETDLTDRDRSHWGVNLFKNFTKELSFGVEVGNFEMSESDADSNYVQLSAKYVL
ncbi:MAG: porin [Colwellia sp.]